ncbi:MAG TPA: DinB family protein [candidate division Zixibacteria bacterium]|nr:DinB family protein [candidate division Zixibacteria bacterium]
MTYRIGVEDIEPRHWVAWVFDLPGCYSKAVNREDAIAGVPSRIADYFDWLASHQNQPGKPPGDIEVEIAESFQSFVSEGDYIVNAFFEDDRRPMNPDYVEHIRSLLGFTRNDLTRLVDGISAEQRQTPVPGEVQGTIDGILKHVAWAEWWYFDSLNLAFPQEEMPQDVLRMLDRVREHTLRQLPLLTNNDTLTERMGERWSARKIVRRTLWHERAHTEQIIRYLKRMP